MRKTSFLFNYEIKQNDAWGIYVINMDDKSNKPFKIWRNLKDEAEALRIAGEIVASYKEQGHRCHIHNSLGQCRDL